MSLSHAIIGLAGIVLVSVLTSTTSSAGDWSGTVNATYQRNVRDEARNSADSVIAPQTTSESKQSNVRINYQDVLFSKNLMRLGGNFFIQRDEIADRWNVRPIYSFDLSSAGFAYSSAYSPRTQTSRLRMPDGTYIETRTFFRDWRNTLTVSYRKLPTVTGSYNVARNYDDQPIRAIDRRNRYISAQTSYTLGPVSSHLVYTSSKGENRRENSRSTDKSRTWQGSTGISGTMNALGSFSASYAYLDSRSSREAVTAGPTSTSNVHSIAALAASREWYRTSATASYSGRFLASQSANTTSNVSDEDFSGQLSFTPLSYFSLSATKNYHITSQSRGHQIGEYLLFSASFTRFIRRGVDTKLSWTRTYIQKAVESLDTLGGSGEQPANQSANFSDAVYFSVATVPYHRAKLLADVSVSRANRPWIESNRYLSSGSLSMSVSATRHIDGRLSVAYGNEGPSLDLFHSTYQTMSAGVTYLNGANLNGNLTFSHNSVNTARRQSTSSMNGYVGYSFRGKYSLYTYMNRSRQETPIAGATSIENVVRKPRSWSGQLQTKLSPKTTLILEYLWSAASVGDVRVNKSNTYQIIFHGQF